MSAIIYPNVALGPLATRIVAAGVHYHLYSNTVTPAKSRVLADFVEVAASWYAIAFLNAWTTQSVILDHGVNQANNLAWVNTDPAVDQVIGGYFVTDTTNSDLLWFYQYDTPQTIFHGGGTFEVTPYYGDFSANP